MEESNSIIQVAVAQKCLHLYVETPTLELVIQGATPPLQSPMHYWTVLEIREQATHG